MNTQELFTGTALEGLTKIIESQNFAEPRTSLDEGGEVMGTMNEFQKGIFTLMRQQTQKVEEAENKVLALQKKLIESGKAEEVIQTEMIGGLSALFSGMMGIGVSKGVGIKKNVPEDDADVKEFRTSVEELDKVVVEFEKHQKNTRNILKALLFDSLEKSFPNACIHGVATGFNVVGHTHEEENVHEKMHEKEEATAN